MKVSWPKICRANLLSSDQRTSKAQEASEIAVRTKHAACVKQKEMIPFPVLLALLIFLLSWHFGAMEMPFTSEIY